MSKTIFGYVLLVAIFSPAVNAQWTDACNYPTNIPTELVDEVDRLLEAEAVLINKQFVTGPLSNGDYMLNNMGPFTEHPYGDPPVLVPLCQESLFYGDTRVTAINSARSGFLIAPDMIATTPHSAVWDPSNYYVVFGLSRGAYASPCNTVMDPYLSADDVYEISTDPNEEPINTYPNGDFMAFHLDRSVQGRRWLRMRSSGKPSTDDVLAIAGHPKQLVTKFEYGVTYEGTYEEVGPIFDDPYDPDRPVFFNFHVASGSSGSPLYNLTKGVVETAIRGTPWKGTVTTYLPDPPYECMAFVDTYDDYELPVGIWNPRPDALNTGRIENFTAQVPSLEARLAPMEDKTYVLPADGSVQPPSTTYTVTASPFADWDIYVGAFIQPYDDEGPALLTNGVGMPFFDGDVEPGQVVSFTVDTDVPTGVACGTYDRYLGVAYSGGIDDYVRHRFEIGLKEISVEPAEDWVDNDIGVPFTQTKTYTVRNVRPSPTTVWVYAGGPLPASVIRINGSDELVSVNLGPAGSATDSTTFEISIDPSIYPLTVPGTVYEMSVAFANADYQCAAQDIPMRSIFFKRGQRVYSSEDDLTFIPAVGPWAALGSPVLFDIDLTQAPDVCAGDINLDVGFYTILGGAMGQSNRAYIKLIAPDGTSGVLWNSNTDPGGAYDVSESGSVIEYLHLDDELTPPLGPQMLSAFDGEGIKGHWTVELRSSGDQYLAGLPRLDVTVGQCDSRQ